MMRRSIFNLDPSLASTEAWPQLVKILTLMVWLCGVAPVYGASITSVNSTSSDGTYRAGQSITIKVTFDQVVTVTTSGGTPTLTLETGTSNAVVNYSSGSGSTDLIFNYVVASGHTSADLDYVSSSALALNGGTIRDGSNNNASLTLPAPGVNGSLSSNSSIVIDGVAPTVTSITSPNANGTYKIGDVIDIEVQLSEPVIITGTPRIALETGATDAVANYSGGTGIAVSTLTFTYTVASPHASSDLDAQSTSALALNGGSILDTAGNAATLSLPVGAISGSLASNKAIIIDGVTPTVSSVSSTTSSGSYRAGQTVSIQVVFSESVTVTGTPQLTLETGASDAVVNYVSGSGTATLNFTYTIVAGHASADLDYVSIAALALNGGSITDGAGNSATVTLATPGAANSLGSNAAIIVDTSSPTVTSVSSTTTNGSYRAGQPINVRVTFSETVIVTGTPQITLETGTSDAVVNYASGSNSANVSFTYTVQAGHTSSDLDYISTTALTGTFKDAAGNDAVLTLPSPGAAGSLAANKAIVIDTTSPNGTLNTSLSSPTSTYPIPITITFAESVTGLALTDFTVTNGCVTNLAGSGSSYTMDLNPNSNNSITLQLGAGTVTDTAGNSNAASSPLSIAFSTVAPRVTNVSSTTANSSYKAGSTISIQVYFSEAVTVSGTPRLALETGASDAVVNYTSGSGSTSLTFDYTVAAGHTSADLDYQSVAPLALNGGTIIDTATSTNNAAFIFACPGSAGSLGANKAIIVDTTRPTVSNVTSATANGSYKSGSSVGVTVNFSEAVYVTGSPQITLETGTTDAVASYVSGSGTTALVFSFTVQSGYTASDLDYTSTTALALNGGSLKDLAGNDATLTLASPGAANSLGSAKNIIIDTTAPTVTNVTASNANASYTVGTVINVQVVFSEAVTVTGPPTISLDLGVRTVAASYASGSASNTLVFAYTVAPGDTSSDLAYVATTSLSVNGGTIRDAAGNDATITLASPGSAGSLDANKNIVIDTTAPTVVSVSSETADGFYSVGQTISIQVSFSETVNVTGTPTLAVAAGAGVNATYTSGSGSTTLTFSYTVGAGQSSNDLDYSSATPLSGAIGDIATNAANLTLPTPGTNGSISYGSAIVIDTQAATIQSVTSNTANGSYKAGDTISLTVTFSELVNVTGSPTLTLETGTTDALATYSSGSGSTQLHFTYTISAGENSGDLEVVGTTALALNSGAIRDRANNNATLTISLPALSSSSDIIVDTTKPGVSIASSTSSPTNTSPIPVTITFTEAVTGFSIEDLQISNGAGSSFSAVSASVYTFNVVPGGDGAVEISIAQDVASDITGNLNTAAPTLSINYDSTDPTVTLTSSVTNRTNLSSFSVSITFSEDTSDFNLTDIAVINGTASDLQGSGASYTANIAPDIEGIASVLVAADSAHDPAGNGNSASNTVSTIYDISSPHVTITSNSAARTNLPSIPIRFEFEEGVSGFTLDDIEVINGAVTNLIAESSSVYLAEVEPFIEGVVAVALNTGVAIDAAGNFNQASNTLSRIYDITPPTANLSSSTSSITNISPIPFDLTFSESVTGLSTEDLLVTNGTITNITGSGSFYSVTVTPSTNGLVTLSVIASAATDSAGNGSSASNALTRTFDTVAPNVVLTSAVGASFGTSPISITITFSEAVTGFSLNDISVVNGTAANLSGSDSSYTVSISPTIEGVVSVSIQSDSAEDSAGNGNTSSNTLASNYDLLAPHVTLSTLLPPITNSPLWSITLTFSEIVTGLNTADFSVSNGVVTSITGSGLTFTASVAPSSEGEVSISLSSDAVQDAAGNGNTASDIMTRIYDSLAPTSPAIIAPSDRALLSTSMPMFTGTGEANSTIKVLLSGTTLCETTASSNGDWSCTSSSLPEGRHQIRASSRDAAGNTSTLSSPIAIVIDALRLASPYIAQGLDSISTNKTPTLFGSGTPSTIVNVRLNDVTICSTQVASNGDWSCTTLPLATGVHNLIAWAQDPQDDTVSDEVAFSVNIGVPYTGLIYAADREQTPIEGVDVSYEQASVTSGTGGAFTLAVPDLEDVTPTLTKSGWRFNLVSSDDGIYRYLGTPTLGARSYAIWDSPYIEIGHSLRLLNKDELDLESTTTLYGPNGDPCGAALATPLSTLSSTRVPLTTGACPGTGGYGLIEVTNDGYYDGEYESRVPQSMETAIRTSALMPLTNSTFERSYLSFDTGAAILDRAADRRFVENVLIISNVGSQDGTYVLNYGRSSGVLWRSERVAVKAKGSSRIIINDIKQSGSVFGYVEIIPENPAAEYVAAIRRYGHSIIQNKKTKAIEKSKTFYVLSDYARAPIGKRFAARFNYTTPLASENFLELINTTSRTINATITHIGLERNISKPKSRADKGKSAIIRNVTKITVPLGPLITNRLKFSRFIKNAFEGTLSIEFDRSNSALVNIATHTYNARRLLTATKLTPLTAPFGDDLNAAFDSSQPAAVMLTNTSSQKISATVSCLISGNLVGALPFSIDPGLSVETPRGACFGSASSGVIRVNSSEVGALTAQRNISASTRGIHMRGGVR